MSGDHVIKKHYWISCPNCKARTRVKVFEDTVLINFPLYCTRCKREFIVGVIKFKMVISDEPDA
ncbi:MAG: conjugal transfer protein [Oscillospiraceae bacterium]|nr:conjugal transfer protein [Oscillospiraceae bacterium]